MLNSANSTTRQRKGAPQPTAHAGDPVLSGHGFSRAVQTRPQEPSPFARLSDSRRLGRSSARYSHSALPLKRRAGIMSTTIAKLAFPLTLAKSITSKFLIDNFCTLLRSPVSKSTSVGISGALHSPLACPERSRRITCRLLAPSEVEGSLATSADCEANSPRPTQRRAK